MDVHQGEFVYASRGRDAGACFIVISQEDNYLYLADGKSRKVGSPKKKKLKHVVFIARPDTRVREKLISNELIYDAEIRKSLRQLGFCDDYDGYGKAEDN